MSEKRSVDFLPQIDGLRFVAVFGVMMFHWAKPGFANSYILANIPFGTGVNLFFVISGFLITLILLKKKETIAAGQSTFLREIKNFYAKRTLRIFPIYYLLIALLCFFSYSDIKDYLKYLLTYTINWYMVIKGVYLENKTHLWSLAVEEQFYLIWPFLIFIIPKRLVPALIVLSIGFGVASKIYFMYYTSYWMGISASTFSCFDSLGFGALIAYIHYKRTGQPNLNLYKAGLLLSIICYIILFVNPGLLSADHKNLFSNFGTSAIYFFVISIAANNGFTGGMKYILENKVVLYLGQISYGLYLYHSFAPDIYFSKFSRFFSDQADYFVLYFIITVAISTLSWYIIEKPVLSLKKYFQ